MSCYDRWAKVERRDLFRYSLQYVYIFRIRIQRWNTQLKFNV